MLDLIMSDVDGFELCRRIKEYNNCKDIPVIAFSASPCPSNQERILSIGAYKTFPIKRTAQGEETALAAKHKCEANPGGDDFDNTI